jgi:hypothetical protein
MNARILTALALCAAPALAQSYSREPAPLPPVTATGYGSITYAISWPTGDLHRFISNDSWLNFSIEGHGRLFNPWSSIGFVIGYNEFYERNANPFFVGNAEVTGQQYRHFLLVPVLIDGRAYLTVGPAQLFGGLGLGLYWGRQQLSLNGLGGRADNSLHFGLMPEVGGLIPLGAGGGFGLTANLRYHYPFASSGYLLGQSIAPGFLALGVGIVYQR